jgi:RNA polymerase sigma factor (sigma-70 family)
MTATLGEPDATSETPRPLEVETARARFERVVGAFGPVIGRAARSYARTSAEREDLEQDIALALWRALPGFRGECSEHAFVLRVAHNQALSFLTRRRARLYEPLAEEPASEAPDPELVAGLSERMRAVFGAIHALPPARRQVLVLGLEGLSHEQIGEVLGISTGNVAVRVNRARAELALALGEQNERQP